MLRHAEELFEQGDANKDGMLSSDELQQLLLLVGNRISSSTIAFQLHCTMIPEQQLHRASWNVD